MRDEHAGLVPGDGVCEAAAYDADGNTLWECWSTNVEALFIGDDQIELCPKHRHWAAAMGAP